MQDGWSKDRHTKWVAYKPLQGFTQAKLCEDCWSRGETERRLKVRKGRRRAKYLSALGTQSERSEEEIVANVCMFGGTRCPCLFSEGKYFIGSSDCVPEETRPDKRLPQSRAGGQGPYLRSLDHLGRSSEVKE